MMEYKLILLAVMIVLSGFFSMSETAFVSLSHLRIRHLIEKKVKRANLVSNLKDNMHKLIIAILIGNNVVNIAASAIATTIALEFSQSWGVSIATGAMTLLILIFGEVTPKSLAIMHSEKICFKIAPFMKFLMILLMPFIFMLDLISKKITKREELENNNGITEEEVKSIIRMGEEVGSIEKEEKEMIQNIFKFNDIAAVEVMTPRPDVFCLNADKKISDVLEIILEKKFSRIPVYENKMENLIGLVHIRTILQSVLDKNLDKKLKDIMLPIHMVPESKKIDDVLEEFQNKKIQLAVVIDEYGGVAGIITVEDLIEEIVGEIYDEKDIKMPIVRKINKSTAIVRGKARIDEINKQLNIRLKENKSYDTISGMIMDKLERIPKVGDSITIRGHEIIVEKATKKRVIEVKIKKR
ncbi:MAG: HlyC/CorC family transporter [Nanoarchaeota archaeon]|nr:HlyC/CorC family transporter [Nanoarchaeota archaeon]MCK5630423.1 HlyC/CorC family transporter [Nanoarchaeota archaeon]